MTSSSGAGSSRSSPTSVGRPGSTSAHSNGCSLPAVVRPRSIGRDAKGRLVVPTTTLYALVPGIRAQVPDGRERLIEYLLENFDEIVYV